ncbi:DUF1016 domain-containing protein [Granulicella sp. WH15]|uniref:PDDEXK nuclease domain-containing protein n=1 Tax=Granulicella sp. WH15 TaxID=2602070 RepID=UPI001366AC8F|nr:PDDEXK nuclease domain-containing protein [Granulicella sp. WH15]QHN02927.1 DUF1016 domain-containing protein [Granulicella sp. WH15]
MRALDLHHHQTDPPYIPLELSVVSPSRSSVIAVLIALFFVVAPAKVLSQPMLPPPPRSWPIRAVIVVTTPGEFELWGTHEHLTEALDVPGVPQVAPSLLLKDPYVLDFLGLTDRFLERDLEDAILRELETFLLELGSGFSFIARQKRIQVDGDDFYMDLLFYNRRLKRLVVVELKQGRFKPEYKGQMELYLRWLAQHELEAGENAPLGIILCAGKNTEQMELLELGSAGIYVAEYLTILPPPEVMYAKLHEAIETARARIEAKPREESKS